MGDVALSVIKTEGFEALLKRPPPGLAAILIHGSDAGAVRDLAKKAVKRFAGSLDDPFNVVELDDAALGSDPGRLADEVGALSMMGGDRVVWVTHAGDHFHKSIEPLLLHANKGSLVVAEADALSKASKLRALFEKSPRAAIVPVYEADDNQIQELIGQVLAANRLTIEPDARTRLGELLGADRALSGQELEKLALYCLGAKVVRLADVEAICGDASDIRADDLLDAVFTGDGATADRYFSSLTASGEDASRLVTLALQHAARLQGLKVEIDRGQRPDQVLRGAKPPIFFKRQSTIQNQLRVWDMQSLLSAGSTLSASVLQMRQYPALADAIANRTLLALARNARARQ